MTIDNKTKDRKLQYNINREAAKISALLSGKFDKYEYLKNEKTLPSDQSWIKEQAKFTYFSLCKAFEKKKFDNQGIKQVEALKALNKKWK